MECCQDCGSKLAGRIDKKFCSDICRSNYNNMLNKKRDTALKQINSILKKNVIILQKLNGYGIKALQPSLLETAGFNFNFFTHQVILDQGKKYNCCYNYGYHMINKEEIELITINEPENH